MYNYTKNSIDSQDQSTGLIEILSLIAGNNIHTTKRSGKSYMVNCPAHRDTHASLAIAEGYDSRILLHCFAGCTAQEICNSLGIKINALFPKKARA